MPLKINTFTTRIDTLYGVTFLVLAPENPIISSLVTPDQAIEVKKYIDKSINKSERDRQISKEKTGVFTGSYAKHPLTAKNIPIWVADYVLYSYGTGAIMAVPAHDQRDFEFALKYNLPIEPVIKPINKDLPEVLNEAITTNEGTLVNSSELSGLEVDKAKAKLSSILKSKGLGYPQKNYKFRNWVFSRQRYWGEPFPLQYLVNDSN